VGIGTERVIDTSRIAQTGDFDVMRSIRRPVSVMGVVVGVWALQAPESRRHL